MALKRTIPGGLNAPAQARAAVAAREADLGWRAGDARMIASELVLNAWQHGHGLDERPISLTLTTTVDGGIRIEVHDRGEGFDVDKAIANTRPYEPGWGLTIIHTLSDDWGVERDDGTRVWATVRPRAEPGGFG